MLKKLKMKFIAFFEGYFVEILKQQEATRAELQHCEERIVNLENELSLAKAELNTRIQTTENNLNYYAMIRSIMEENTYVGHELHSLLLQESDSPKILIAGFYGADNFGDEIMLQTLLSAFPEEMLSSVTVMLCDNSGYDYFHLPGVNFIHIPKKTFDCNLIAKHFDVLIWGGGALIDDGYYDYGPTELNNLFLCLSERFIAFKKKVVSLGLSTNREFTNQEYCLRLKNVVDGSCGFYLRDENSIEVLKNLGIENVDFFDDVVFYNKIWEQPVLHKEARDVPTVGIIWICCDETEALFDVVLEKINSCFGARCKIRLIPFYNYVQADMNFFTSAIERIGSSERISVASYTNRIDAMVSEIASCDYMINMRYHGMLLSGLLKKPSVNICYDIHRHYENKISFLAKVFRWEKSAVYYSDWKKNRSAISFTFLEPEIDSNELVKPCTDLTEKLLSFIK